jgi:predicted small secreted protein
MRCQVKFVLVLLVSVVLAGCNTMAEVGKDMSDAGAAISDAAKK